MSLSQLQYFVAVADAGSIGRAATRLHVSQPPLSRQLKSLEDELGTALFERTSTGVRLLPAGQDFLVHARHILEQLNAAVTALREAHVFPLAGTAPENSAAIDKRQP